MDGDIWFNTNVLNDPSVDFELLDAVQLIYHEFAHTLPGSEDIELNNKIAAKIKDYLRSFYVKNIIDSETTACFLTLPYLKSEGDLLDFQPHPIVIINVKGISFQADFDGSQLGAHPNGYWSQSRHLRAFTRVNLKPQAQKYEGSLLLTWQVEFKELLRVAPVGGFNHISLSVSESLTSHQEVFPPVISQKILYHRIPWPKLRAAALQQASREVPMPLQIFAEGQIHFISEFSQPWVEVLKLTKRENGRNILEGVVKSKEPMREVSLIGQYGNSVIHFPGEFENLTGDYYKLRFSVPEGGIGGQNLVLSGIAVNSKGKWDFAEILILPTRPVVGPRKPKLKNIYVWNGISWLSVKELTSESLDVETEIRLRYEFIDAAVNMNHVEVSWLLNSDITKDDKYPGYLFQTDVEVIPAHKLSQRRQGDTLTVEFSSPIRPPRREGREGIFNYRLEPADRVSMSMVQFVGTDLHATSVGIRPIESPWKYVFPRKMPSKKTQFFCSALLGIK
jgi:hypothetical protein